VLSLPSTLTSDELHQHFATLKLPITDAKVLHKKDGTSRRIGFVGFSDLQDAQKAREWFDATWLAGSRIKVDFAKEISEEGPSRKRRRTSDDAYEQRESSAGHPAALSTSQAPVDLVDASHWPQDTMSEPNQATPAGLDDSISDAEYLSHRVKKTVGAAEAGQSTSLEPGDVEQSQRPQGKVAAHEQPRTATERIMSTARLFLRNLSFQAKESDLRQLFEKYGRLDEVSIPGSASATSRGIAFVRFADPSSAVEAYKQEDGKPFLGRLLHVLPASSIGTETGSSRESGTAQIDPPSYKISKLRTKQDEAAAGTSRKALFVNNDAVMEAVAARLKTSKAALVGPESSNASSRLALAESYLLQELRDQLSADGVNVDRLSDTNIKSKDTLIIKNLPYDTRVGAVKSMLASYGHIRRLAMPSTGLIAVVEMESPTDASAAIRALTYSKLNATVIYLEKAPANVWDVSDAADGAVRADMRGDSSSALEETAATVGTQSSTAMTDSNTLFVKNIAFTTTQDALEHAFRKLSGAVQVRLASRSSNGARSRHAGYGFLTFSTKALAMHALESMQGYLLDGHSLELQYSRNTEVDSAAVDGQEDGAATVPGNRLIIKNLPFEVARRELQELLGTFGKIKSLRIPKKADNTSRGFAFVQYTSSGDAQAALRGLRDTHILGRHLIIEQTQQ